MIYHCIFWIVQLNEERISEGGTMPSLGFRSCVELQVAGV